MAKLMLVEDDNNLREIYEARLQAEGYEIVTAKDGEEALVTAKAQKPDLIIADIMMPKISGFEMLDILRNTEGLKDVKIIMLTALGQNDDQQKANRLGADRYLVKSQVTLEDIVKVTHELLNDQAPATDNVAPPNTPPAAPASTQPATATTTAPVSAPEPSAPSDATDTPAPAVAVSPSPTNPPVQDDKIENFVAGATEEATPPIPEPTPPEAAGPPPVPQPDEPTVASAVPAEPAATTSPPASAATTNVTTIPVSQPEPAASTPPTDGAAASDEQLVAEAAQKLMDSTKPAETPIPADNTQPPPPAGAGPAEVPAATAASEETKSAKPGAPRHHSEIVITPLETSSEKDINSLLAIEEAKEATRAATEALPTPVVAANDPVGQPADTAPNPVITPSPEAQAELAVETPPAVISSGPAANDPADPNSIAL